MKASRENEQANAGQEIRVQPLFLTKRRSPRRSYLVFSNPRQTVVVTENETGRFASCTCSPDAETACEHIQIVAAIDRKHFPQDVAEMAQAAA